MVIDYWYKNVYHRPKYLTRNLLFLDSPAARHAYTGTRHACWFPLRCLESRTWSIVLQLLMVLAHDWRISCRITLLYADARTIIWSTATIIVA